MKLENYALPTQKNFKRNNKAIKKNKSTKKLLINFKIYFKMLKIRRRFLLRLNQSKQNTNNA